MPDPAASAKLLAGHGEPRLSHWVGVNQSSPPTLNPDISMKPSTRNKAAGTVNIAKGDTKIALSKVTRSRLLEAKGRAQKLVGQLQRNAGKQQKARGQ